MSATRNPFYQLPGGADLPGDVRVSDTADATKTAAGGWAASPAAVEGAVSEMKISAETGSISSISDTDIFWQKFGKIVILSGYNILISLSPWGFADIANLPFKNKGHDIYAPVQLARNDNAGAKQNSIFIYTTGEKLSVHNWGNDTFNDVSIAFQLVYICE